MFVWTKYLKVIDNKILRFYKLFKWVVLSTHKIIFPLKQICLFSKCLQHRFINATIQLYLKHISSAGVGQYMIPFESLLIARIRSSWSKIPNIIESSVNLNVMGLMEMAQSNLNGVCDNSILHWINLIAKWMIAIIFCSNREWFY